MPRGLVLATFLLLLSSGLVADQPLSVLHVKVVLLDAEGRPTPVPRHALLISDNPPTASPRRVVTGPDGTVAVKLRPGSYTVESDEPAVIEGRAYRWTQMIDIPAGHDLTLQLTAGNVQVEVAAADAATTGCPAPCANDPSAGLASWYDSVVTLWTPTSRALGVIVDARGLVVTSRRAIGGTASAEVQLTPTVKVAGRVVVASPANDVAVLWIDPTVAASARPVPLGCDVSVPSSFGTGQDVVAIDASRQGTKSLTSGAVAGVDSQGLWVDFRVEPRSAGGPVFAPDGRVVGITSQPDEVGERRRGDSRVVRVGDVCEVLESAEEKIRGGAPPSAAHLPVEPARPFPLDALEDAAKRRAGAGPYQVSSSDFDISFITPQLVYAARHRWGSGGAGERSGDPRWSDQAQARFHLLTDFGDWSDYVNDVPPVLLVRVTPRFVEGFWTMVGRAAASTQGVSIPPVKRFKPGFARMRAFCGASEVTPIHAFALEQRLSEDTAIREGLYAFDPGALGPACGTVKLVLFSEKAPDKGDTRVVDPGVLEQVWRDFAPFRDSSPKQGGASAPPAPWLREDRRARDVSTHVRDGLRTRTVSRAPGHRSGRRAGPA